MNKLELQRIKLTNFKNYEFEDLTFCSKFNLFIGNNGMGKTNLLDAIHYLCTGKSKFLASDRLLSRHGTDFFRLEGRFLSGNEQETVVAKVANNRKKALECNGIAYQKLSQHIGRLPCVFIAPDDIYLIREGSEERRKFLDNILSQLSKEYLQNLMLYNSILKQRNAILKQWKERPDPALLDIYSDQLVVPAGFLHHQRADFVHTFLPLLEEKYQCLSNDQEAVNLKYHSQLNENAIADLLREAREKDILLQRTTVGIHKDDLKFRINGHPLKQFGSQGQLKSFLLALKLTEYQVLKTQKQIKPILILDDIFDKLDQNRIRQLIEIIVQESYGQVFISDTHPLRLQEIIGLQVDAPIKNYKIVAGSANLF